MTTQPDQYAELRAGKLQAGEPQAGPVPSPCVSLCEMAPGTGLCKGCLRTIDEIVAWGTADDAFKRAVWAQIRQRESELAWK